MPRFLITNRPKYIAGLGQENPRLKEWWYVKRRKQPFGKIGRPRKKPLPAAPETD